MSHFKMIHHSKLDLDHNGENENLKVLCEKLYDKPFRTHVYFKPKQSTALKEPLLENRKRGNREKNRSENAPKRDRRANQRNHTSSLTEPRPLSKSKSRVIN